MRVRKEPTVSRTIKTMPWNVQAFDAHAIVEHHYHNGKACNLPPRRPENVGWAGHDCRFDANRSFYYTHHFCGCRTCTDYYGRLWERRRSRHQAKHENRTLVKYGLCDTL